MNDDQPKLDTGLKPLTEETVHTTINVLEAFTTQRQFNAHPDLLTLEEKHPEPLLRSIKKPLRKRLYTVVKKLAEILRKPPQNDTQQERNSRKNKLATTGIRVERVARAKRLKLAFDEEKSRIEQTQKASEEQEERDQIHEGKRPYCRRCYICKQGIEEIHVFYDQLCVPCGDFNFMKRQQTGNLECKIALVTGARIKIGFQICLKLLRAGAIVIATTRFVNDALKRYQAELDFKVFQHRLELVSLDLRFVAQIEALTNNIKSKYRKLDILVNNACQTIRRPPEFYADLIAGEHTHPFLLPLSSPSSSSSSSPSVSVTPSQNAEKTKFKYDEHHQLVEARIKNSWTSQLHEISPTEVAETQLINVMAPFVLIQQLMSIMSKQDTDGCSWIINVSAMEGQFSRIKTTCHPHTNMAKAALNMLTHTSARQFANEKIWMNSVDTGWCTDETPAADHIPPIDEVDGAARVLDLVFVNSSDFGKFWKDYKVTTW
jgi:NAD(P)-dependent dehydrogenase (short-subunit alcohol dehydrogenase family)